MRPTRIRAACWMGAFARRIVCATIVASLALLGCTAQGGDLILTEPVPLAADTRVAEPTAVPSATATDAPVPTLSPPRPTWTPTPLRATLVPTAGPDPIDARVDRLLAAMTVEEKVGQLFLVFFYGPYLSPALSEMITDYHVGGILLFGIAGNVRDPVQVAQLINEAQSEAIATGAQIPLFVAVDQEGGPVVRLTEGATVFPSNMAVGATGSVEHARRMATVTARELQALGINVNLAPVIDVNNNPDNPVIGIRSFGASPQQVAQLGSAMIEAYQREGILATAKHFPGHGDTAIDSHVGLPLLSHDRERLETVELVPFEAAIQADVAAIMTAHVVVPALSPQQPDLPATLAEDVLRSLLRERLGYEGLIVTDSLGMGAIDQTYGAAEAARLAFQAGADILAFGADPAHTPEEQRPAVERLIELVESGDILQERLDQSVRRILLAKARHGVLDWAPVDVAEIRLHVGTAEHARVARQVARDSITLVRDEPGNLPIAAGQSVLAVWPSGTGDLGAALGLVHLNLDVLRVSAHPSPAEIQQVVSRAGSVDLVVVGTADVRWHASQAHLVHALSGRPVVAVALGGPYDLASYPEVSTYLATYGSVPASLEALARVLVGLEKPAGHLPTELPGLYPLGQGLDDFVSVHQAGGP